MQMLAKFVFKNYDKSLFFLCDLVQNIRKYESLSNEVNISAYDIITCKGLRFFIKDCNSELGNKYTMQEF